MPWDGPSTAPTVNNPGSFTLRLWLAYAAHFPSSSQLSVDQHQGGLSRPRSKLVCLCRHWDSRQRMHLSSTAAGASTRFALPPHYANLNCLLHVNELFSCQAHHQATAMSPLYVLHFADWPARETLTLNMCFLCCAYLVLTCTVPIV